MKNKRYKSGFTLIELLMVIAVVGILAGILIPAIGVVQERAKIAQSKMQLSNYVNAIQLFKAEYKYYPFPTDANEEFRLTDASNSQDFIETLSARDANDPSTRTQGLGNRRFQSFHSFGEKEYFLDPGAGTIDRTRIADAFSNVNIVLLIDTNNDGVVTPQPLDQSILDDLPDPSNPEIRTTITFYVDTDPNPLGDGNPTYGLWD
ncbi:MAG: type II secretion system protein [Coraliomargarita sp.]